MKISIRVINFNVNIIFMENVLVDYNYIYVLVLFVLKIL